jgi:hypothetical protein
MPACSRKEITRAAEAILRLDPDPVPRFRLLRDVLRLPPEDAELRRAGKALEDAALVRLLRGTQLPDGTWGRFHSRDSRIKAAFPTTELAIKAALSSGLDARSPLLRRTIRTIELYAQGRAEWPDPPEKHDNPLAWRVWERHFSAAVLAEIEPGHPLLEGFRRVWGEAFAAAFRSGAYYRAQEIRSLNGLLGCRMKDPVPFHRKYPLLILSSGKGSLSPRNERLLLDFVMNLPEGIYYVHDGKVSDAPSLRDGRFWPWMAAQALLSRFGAWRRAGSGAVDHAWSMRGADGLWDPGPGVARRPYTPFPLSEDWRKPGKRVIDASIEILALVSRARAGRRAGY